MNNDLVSSQIGRYTVLEMIGSGGMATVYRARDLNLDRDVAIKVMHEHLLADPTFKERFDQEARTIARFNHPNIVQVYDYDVLERDGMRLVYMVMRYAADRTLDTIIKEYRRDGKLLPLQQVKSIMLDLCAALEYAHERGMVHRDVKPANILMDNHGTAILTDFGIARLAQSANITQEGIIIGTPAYMSPEQATGDPVDGRSDLYALGVILFELLTGRLPFEGSDTIAILLKHVNTPAPKVSDWIKTPTPNLDAITSRALAKQPIERYATAEAFAIAIRSISQADEALTTQMPHVQLRLPTETVVVSPTRILATANISQTILRTLNSAVLKPAQQNPVAFISLAIALLALLFVARLTQPSASPVVALTPRGIVDAADSMTETAVYGKATFDEGDPLNADWELLSDGLIDRKIVNGVYDLWVFGQNKATATLLNPQYIYKNVQITMDATLMDDSEPNSGYGIVFRYQDPDNYNVFAVDGRGRYSIWKRESGTWYELRDEADSWTPTDAALLQGQTNKLTIIVFNNLLVGYINGKQIVRLQEDTFAQGAIGIYLATPANGIAHLNVDSYLIAPSENPAFSMTDSYSSGSATRTATATPTP